MKKGILYVLILSMLLYSVSAYYCYQEFANVTSSYCTGTLATGSYNVFNRFTIDGNYSTYGETDGEYSYVTYHKPQVANLKKSYWQIKDAETLLSPPYIVNLSLLPCSLNGNDLELGFLAYGIPTVTFGEVCYNGQQLRLIEGSTAFSRFFEEGIFWQMRNITTNLSSFGSYQRSNPSISYSTDGFETNVSCSAYSNVTNLNCSQSTSGIINCQFINYFSANTSINVTPYCCDYECINATSKVILFKYGYLDRLNITLYDLSTNSKIDNYSINMRLTSNISDTFYNVSNGSIMLNDTRYGTYRFQFTSTNYSTKYFDYVVNTSDFQSADFYLLPKSATLNTILTIKDADTGIIISGALLTAYNYLNNSYKVTDSLQSDISGKIRLDYLADTQYFFNLSKTGYNTLNFELNPILYSTYDILLQKNTGTIYQDRIVIDYDDNILVNGTDVNFTFTWSSPYNELLSYGYTLTMAGGQEVTFEGQYGFAYPQGQTYTASFNLAHYSVLESATLFYWYNTTNLGVKNFTVSLPVRYSTTGTLGNIKDNTYGLGLFERILIAVIILIFVVGIATLIGQLLAGLGLGLLVMAYLSFIGFIPIWAIALSLIIGFLLLAWRTGGY